MKEKEHGCGCSSLSYFTTCDVQTETSSSEVEVIEDTNTIQPTDHILIIRNDCNGKKVFQASWQDLSPQTALFILSKAVQGMSQKDPGDGFTLWNDDGFIRVASGLEQQGRIGASALLASMEDLFKKLPTTNPNDGTPWNNGGFIVQGTNIESKKNG